MIKTIFRILSSIIFFIPAYLLLLLSYSIFTIAIWTGLFVGIYSGLMVLLCNNNDKDKWKEKFHDALYIFLYPFCCSFMIICKFAIYGKTTIDY